VQNLEFTEARSFLE